MDYFSCMVPEDTKQIEIFMPLPKEIDGKELCSPALSAGPKHLKLEVDSKIIVPQISGGPATLTVVTIAEPIDGMKLIKFQLEGIKTIKQRIIFDCSK